MSHPTTQAMTGVHVRLCYAEVLEQRQKNVLTDALYTAKSEKPCRRAIFSRASSLGVDSLPQQSDLCSLVAH